MPRSSLFSGLLLQRRTLRTQLSCGLALILLLSLAARPIWGELPPGSGNFLWEDTTGRSDPAKVLEVFYFRPDAVTADTPFWMIMHGTRENADEYRDWWAPSAAAQGALVITPKMVPGKSDEYELGNVSVSQYDTTPKSKLHWSFSKIEPLFDYVQTLEPALKAEHYYMFGHSGGSQFAHRFLMWNPDARVRQAVLGNAGWYTLPQYRDSSYQYGWPYTVSDVPDMDLEESGYQGFPPQNLLKFLARDVVVLLGEEDTFYQRQQTPGAMAQGTARFYRGQFFFARGEAEAKARGVRFGWRLSVVPGIGHNATIMAWPAAEIFRRTQEQPIGGLGTFENENWKEILERAIRHDESQAPPPSSGNTYLAVSLVPTVIIVVVVVIIVRHRRNWRQRAEVSDPLKTDIV